MNKIIVADNQELYRIGVVELLSKRAEFGTIIQISDLKSLVIFVASNQPLIVIASTSLVPEPEHLVLRAREAGSRVLLVADDSNSLSRYRSARAADVVHRNTTGVGLIESLRRTQRQIQVALPARRRANEGLIGIRAADALSTGEMKVVALLMQGFKTRRISERLGISEAVVRGKFQRIYDKTGLSTRLELALYVSEHRAFAAAVTATFAGMEHMHSEFIHDPV